MLTVFVFIFIVTGNIFGALLFQDEYREEVNYGVGGFNTIAEAQTRGKMYVPRMEKELNYSSNIIALNLNNDETPAKWGYVAGVPSKEQVKNSYEEAVKNELQSQSQVLKCSNPQIGGIKIQDYTNYTAELSTDSITCKDRSTEAKIKLDINRFWTNNSNNRYINLSITAVDLAEHLEEKDLPENWGEGTGYSSTSCGPSVDKSSLDEIAKQEAKQKAINDNDLADTVSSNFPVPDWIDLDTYERFELFYDKDPDYDGDCEYKDPECDEEEEDECEMLDGESYSVTYSAEVQDAVLTYSLEDEEREVIDSKAEKRNIEFVFEYFHSIN